MASKPAAKASVAAGEASKSTTRKSSVTTRTRTGANGVKTAAGGRKASGSVSVAVAKADSQTNYDGTPSIETLRAVKTGLTKKDLEAYRRLLLDKWAELAGDVDKLTHDALGDGGDLSHMPMHMADVGTDNYSQSFNLGLMESERKLLNEIADALRRVDNGTYGVCLETAVPIGRPRLDAKPWAKYCIEVARERERRGLGAG